VEDTANAAGYTVVFCNTDESHEKESQYIHLLLQKQVDRFLLVPARDDPAALEAIQRSGAPLVVLDRRIPGAQVDGVYCDSEGGAYQLTRHLIQLGHEHLAVIAGPRGVSTAEERVGGYRRALIEAGVPLREEYILRGELTPAGGSQMTRQIIQLSPCPSALLAANNFLMIGAMKALQASGMRVPEDMALVGFDDLPETMLAFPFFSVARQPAYEMGRCATDLLLARLGGERENCPKEVVLPVELIVRRSSGEKKKKRRTTEH
jgi:LacI family transcriptional regulator